MRPEDTELAGAKRPPATLDENERRGVCQSLRDLIQHGGNMDHEDRKNLMWKAISLIETPRSETRRIDELVGIHGTPSTDTAMAEAGCLSNTEMMYGYMCEFAKGLEAELAETNVEVEELRLYIRDAQVAPEMNSEAENRLGLAERDQTASSGKPYQSAPSATPRKLRCNRCGDLGYVLLTDGLGNESRMPCDCPSSTRSSTRRFPIMRGPNVPWEVMAPHEHQAKRNHSQTLERLAERGGLGTGEAWCVINGLDLNVFDKATWDDYEKKWCAFAERVNLHYAELERLRSAASAIAPNRDAILAEVERGLHDLKNLKTAGGEREQARGVAAAEFHVRALRTSDDGAKK